LIGSVDNPSHQVLLKRKNDLSNDNSLWIIHEKKDLSKTTSMFRFRSSEFVVKNYIKGIEWMGKHFTVRLFLNNKYLL